MIASQPWALDAAQQREIVGALRFGHYKWDAFACGTLTLVPETLVLSEAVHREVVSAVEGLHEALLRFETRVRGDREALRRLGIPEPLHPLVADDGGHELQLARYDLFPTEDGRLMVSEFNEDVPGGFNEAEGLPDLLGTPPPGLRWELGPRERFLEALRPYERVALLYATAFSEDLQHMLILERWLASAGHRTVLGSPAHLRRGWGRPRVFGEAVDAAFRFYPGEWMPGLPNFRTWLRVGRSLPMMNPFRRLVRQSKSMFALWWEDGGLDPGDRALLERHCPRTFAFQPRDVGRLREERERWVLKRAFGRMGDAVVMGNLVVDGEWEAALREAACAPEAWCVQERFTVRPLEFAGGPRYPALGAFVVNGRFAGYYSRIAPVPFLTHEALHVATLVQTA